MKSYRLVVRQQGRIVGHFETSGLDALEDICVARGDVWHHWRLSVRVASVRFRTQDAGEWPGGDEDPDAREVLSPGDLAVVTRGLALKCSQPCRPDKRSAIRQCATPSPDGGASALFGLQAKKMAPKGAILHCAKNYFLMRITGVSPTVTLPDSLISSLISSMLEITTGVRVDLAFSSSNGRSNSMTGIANFHALTFFSNTLEAFAFQLNGVDTEVNEQLNAAIGFDRERMVGFKDFADGTVNRGDHFVTGLVLIAMPSPTIFSAKTTSGTSSIVDDSRQRAGQQSQ
ncbi:putative cytoplasmic protein [Salmonella enterica subsp. enterica serovar Pullorum]|nr:putative cytoplasmic protein [Salmonella enterica subsp. enterica serovar Pullorum]